MKKENVTNKIKDLKKELREREDEASWLSWRHNFQEKELTLEKIERLKFTIKILEELT